MQLLACTERAGGHSKLPGLFFLLSRKYRGFAGHALPWLFDPGRNTVHQWVHNHNPGLIFCIALPLVWSICCLSSSTLGVGLWLRNSRGFLLLRAAINAAHWRMRPHDRGSPRQRSPSVSHARRADFGRKQVRVSRFVKDEDKSVQGFVRARALSLPENRKSVPRS